MDLHAYGKEMAVQMYSFVQDSEKIRPRLLSPFYNPIMPDVVSFSRADALRRSFKRRFLRSPANRFFSRDSIQKILERAVEIKVEADAGYDISVALYPYGFRFLGQGVLSDGAGRTFSLLHADEGPVQLLYQGGTCRTIQDWRSKVAKIPDDTDNIRSFFNSLRAATQERIALAGTVGFGLWDALWMSFDFPTAVRMLSMDPEAARMIFRYWCSFHAAAAGAMLDAGLKMIVLREHPAGFPESWGMSRILDPFLREYCQELARIVIQRGGMLFLDCDADEMIETDYPAHWGFNGIGPLRFRDLDDLIAAKKSMNDTLILAGLTTLPIFGQIFLEKSLASRLILAQMNDGWLARNGAEESSGFRFTEPGKHRGFVSWIR
ncbi:hypothetical protein [Desulfomonile tiedjei]|nr:hypothetical protein [Desulfomonile tiedjei]